MRDGFAEAARLVSARDDAALEAARVQLEQALEAAETVLAAHLRAEEDAVVPLMLALEPEEFAQYRDLPQAKGPPRPRAF